MEQKLEKLMGVYDDALEELMGAQKYINSADKAETSADKAMYHSMAKQELGHAHELCAVGDRIAAEDAMLNIVWHHLKKHLSDWRADIERKMN